MDKDRRVSIETISAQFDVSVGTLHTIICKELQMRKICAKFVPRVLREDQEERRCHDSKEMVELINSDLAVLDALVSCDESWIYCYEPETKRQNSQCSTGMSYMHGIPTGQTGNKEYYVQGEIPSEEASTLQIGSQFLTLPIVQALLLVTFAYSLSSQAVVMRQLRRWKRLWRRSLTRSHKRTSMGPSRSCWSGTTSALQPEEITSKGTRV